MKRLLLILLFLVVLLLFIACRNEDKPVNEATLSTAHFNEFVYLAESINIGDMTGATVHATVMHNNNFYVLYSGQYRENDFAYILASFDSDGQIIERIKLPMRGFAHVFGMQVTDDNEAAVFFMEMDPFNDDPSAGYLYAEYDFEGNELIRRDFTDLLPVFDGTLAVRQAVFTDDGNIALIFQKDLSSYVYLLSTEDNSVTILEYNIYPQGDPIVRLHDDRVLILDASETGEMIIREVDFDGKKWGDKYPVIATNSSNLRSISADGAFDLLISDAGNLYGYTLKSGEQMQLLSWVEIGHINTADAFIGIFSDGSITVITDKWDVDPEVYILRPILRSENPSAEKIVLTLGGLGILDEILEDVVKFNAQNSRYRIEVIDYEADGDWEDGLARLQIELMTGKGPDIIYDHFRWLRLSGVLENLYPFIDADPELSREDFFPNILRAIQHPEGSLYMISDTFTITTMVGLKENLGHINKWTFSELLSLIENSVDTPEPLGARMLGWVFYILMLENFIDMDNFTANLDNDEVIKILEIAKLLPDLPDREKLNIHMLIFLLSGEQLIGEWQFNNFYDFQGFAEVLGDNFLILGRPSATGGVNIANTHNPMGINAASQHKDGAWEFLRRYLLPKDVPQDNNDSQSYNNQVYYTYYPIRIDTFEAYIANAQTPIMVLNHDGSLYLDDDGQPVEQPHVQYLVWNWPSGQSDKSLRIDLYAMSDDVALMLRNFIESAQPPGNRLNSEVTMLIHSDVNAFFDGTRSAEDTVRIMQNRVQTYLSEQELLR